MTLHRCLSLSFMVCSIVFLFFLKLMGQETEEEISSFYSQPKVLKIKIISYNNGVGLSQDVDILSSELKKLGHNVEYFEEYDFKSYPKADINIFVQPSYQYHEPFMAYAEKNVLIPNHEWCHFNPKELARFDAVLCKTKVAEKIFKSLNCNAIFLGFTCKDCYSKDIKKDFTSALHLAGASVQKGTDRVVKTWLSNPQFPSLYLLKHKSQIFPPSAENIRMVYEYVPERALRNYQNKCAFHICPSETEGFGHYIAEGMSCGAVVITTDAPPVNEFVTGQRCLVGYESTQPLNLATRFFIDQTKMKEVMNNLLQLPVEELENIGRVNRNNYDQMDRLFKTRLEKLFGKASCNESKSDELEKAFREVYQTKHWGDNPSGDGSLPENTEIYRFFLQKFMKEHSIKKVVDLGCGNWSFSKLIDWSGIDYKGFDIYKEMIEDNQKKYASKNIEFIYGNGLEMALPKADLFICKDVLQHLPNDQILKLFPKLANYKHCLIINDVNSANLTSENSDIFPGGCRSLDLTKPPFNLAGKKILSFICGDVTKQALYIQHRENE